MKINNIKYLFITLAVCALTSCSDYLTETNPNFKPKEDYYKTLDEAEATLVTVYGTMLNHYILNIEEEALRSDCGYPGFNRPSPTDPNAVWYYQTYNNGTVSVSKKWEAIYEGVFRSNQVIEGLEHLKENNENIDLDRWSELMGQSKFFRALYHFYAYTSFNNGEVIIRDFVPSLENGLDDFNIPVSDREEVVNFVRNDLYYAYENLPSQYPNLARNKGKVTKGAAATILGLSHIYDVEYKDGIAINNTESIDSAMFYFDDVINNPEYAYELVDDMDLLFTSAGELNKESIFEIVYALGLRPELNHFDEASLTNRLGRSAPGGTIGGGRKWLPTAWLAYEYSHEKMDSQDQRNWVNNDDGMQRMRNVPLRASSMVALVNDIDTKYYIIGNVPQVATFSNYEFAYYKKYTNHDITDSERNLSEGQNRSGKNVTVNRLAEVVLLMAECHIQKNEIQEALDLMNDVRVRWGLELLGTESGSKHGANHDYNNVEYDQTSLMKQLMHIDKPLELSSEGHSIRNIDLRRWGIAKQNFEDLYKRKYWVDTFTFTDLDGKDKNNWRSMIVDYDPGNGSIILDDFEAASQNYINEVHDYLPIPLSEILNNPNIFNKK
ncbi:RagB/SusD family nutrient uptake outer membrane protein [Saccharicrinis aurantiacus]|uniref:RagB/SusD family nutrient uptake outer membrane protein n=1 Tax=Saccharicrinis aurantiacus TaxID=1849719 RepID=UPI0008382E35|nr:RagB/SusD family nutrient uptake outer membrane protein [Saccharicrinis aurantiacus]